MTPYTHLQRHSPVSNNSHYPIVSLVHLTSASDGTDAHVIHFGELLHWVFCFKLGKHVLGFLALNSSL